MSGGVAAFSPDAQIPSNTLLRQYDRAIDTTVKTAPIARFAANVVRLSTDRRRRAVDRLPTSKLLQK